MTTTTEQEVTQTTEQVEDTSAPAEETKADPASLLADDEADQTKPFEKGTRPEGIPDEVWDELNGDIKVDELLKHYQNAEKRAKGLRDKLAKGGDKAPKTAAEYKLEVAEELKSVIPDNDPLVLAGRQIAHKHGLTQEQFQGFMAEMAGEVAKLKSSVENPEPMTAEQLQEYREAEFKKLGANGKAVARAVAEWGRTLHAQGGLSDSDYKTMQQLATTGEAVRLFNVLRTMNGGQQIPVDGAIDDGLPSDAEIAAMIGSRKYMDGDPATHKKVEALLQKRIEAGRPERLQV